MVSLDDGEAFRIDFFEKALARVGDRVIGPRQPDERLFNTFSTSLSHTQGLYSLAGFSISLSLAKQTRSVVKQTT